MDYEPNILCALYMLNLMVSDVQYKPFEIIYNKQCKMLWKYYIIIQYIINNKNSCFPMVLLYIKNIEMSSNNQS